MNTPTAFKDYMSETIDIDLEKLSPKVQRILKEYLIPVNPYIPKETLLNVLLAYISQLGGFHRLTVRSKAAVIGKDNCAPANFYSIVFMNSGSGKDKAQTSIKSALMSDVYEMFDEKVKKYMENKERETMAEADEKFPSNCSPKTKFIEANSPRFLSRELGNATPEGFISLREAFDLANFGGTFTVISEFGDYILADNTARAEFLTVITEVFDLGDSKAKVIKGEKSVKAVNGVPSSIIFHTSLSGLLEGNGHDKLLSFLNRGIARRSFICFPSPVIPEDLDDEDMVNTLLSIQESDKQEADEKMPELKKFFVDMYKSLEYTNIFQTSMEVESHVKLYELFNKQRALSFPEDLDIDGLRAETDGRHWKTLKLACILAAFEHPTRPIIEEKDFLSALYLSEVSGKHLERFFDARPMSDEEKLFNFFLARINNWNARSDISAMNFVYHNKFRLWFEDTLPLVREIANKRGYEIEEKKGEKQWLEYRLVKKFLVDDPKHIVEVFKSNNHLMTFDQVNKFLGMLMTARKLESVNEKVAGLGYQINHLQSKSDGNVFALVEL